MMFWNLVIRILDLFRLPADRQGFRYSDLGIKGFMYGTDSTSFQQGSGRGSPGVEEISKGTEKRGSAIP